jgi:hypothetical protein
MIHRMAVFLKCLAAWGELWEGQLKGNAIPFPVTRNPGKGDVRFQQKGKGRTWRRADVTSCARALADLVDLTGSVLFSGFGFPVR